LLKDPNEKAKGQGQRGSSLKKTSWNLISKGSSLMAFLLWGGEEKQVCWGENNRSLDASGGGVAGRELGGTLG